MYFINFGKCSICNQKKSVAISKEARNKICVDCDKERYVDIANKQKKHWINGKNKGMRN